MNWEREGAVAHSRAQGARQLGRAGAVLGVVALIVIVWAGALRASRGGEAQGVTEAQAVVTVATTKPAAQSGLAELVLPGNIQANYEAPIYARTSGYLKRWLVDIGTPVKAGQLLARDRVAGSRLAAAPGAGGPRDRRRPTRRSPT